MTDSVDRGHVGELPTLPDGDTVKTERIMWLEDRVRGLEREVKVLRWAVIVLGVLVAILVGLALLG